MASDKDQQKNVRHDSFGDDGGTRVGRPDSDARLSEGATKTGLEGSIVESGSDEESQGHDQPKVPRESGRGGR